jgi:uncharacterized protein (TIGR02001 family)
MNQFRLAAALVALAAPIAAQAQDSPGISWGALATSNYIYRGVTYSDNRPALQGYVAATDGFIYGGAWASTVDIDGDYGELDLSIGVTPDFGALDVDISYTRFLYNRSGDCCGEVGLSLGYPLGSVAGVAGAVFWDPENGSTWSEAALSGTVYEDFEIGGSIGSDFGSGDYGDEDQVAWDLGVSYGFLENGTADLRYYQSTNMSARAVLSVGFDF